jgi:hypothetical protein
VGVEPRGEGLAGCSGTQVEEPLFLEWEWSTVGRDWLAVQVHRQKSISSWSWIGAQKKTNVSLFRSTQIVVVNSIAALHVEWEWSHHERD